VHELVCTQDGDEIDDDGEHDSDEQKEGSSAPMLEDETSACAVICMHFLRFLCLFMSFLKMGQFY
jgi:hypothetical protein